MKSLFLSILLLASVAVRAQYVTIPDTAFRNLLAQQYPSAFNASKQMDTTAPAIVNEVALGINVPPNTYWFLTIGGPNFSSTNIKNVWGIQFFKNLLRLGIYNTDIVSLPPLSGITYSGLYLYVVNNSKLKTIHSLPPALWSLDLSHNALTTVPPIPLVANYFDCGNNYLTQLSFRGQVGYAYCDSNQLTVIDNLPGSLLTLDCSYNPHLNCLPRLPAGITSLTCDHSSISCLANKPVSLSTTLPICPNGSSCSGYPTASGLCYIDHDGNNKYDGSIDEPLKYNVLYNNTSVWTATSDRNGVYTISLDSGKLNTFSLLPSRYVKRVTPVSYSVTPTQVISQGINYDFAVQMIPNVHDLEVSIADIVGRHRGSVNVMVKNAGTVKMTSVTVKAVKPSFANGLGTLPGASTQSGDTVIWNGVSLEIGESKTFHIDWDIANWINAGTPYTLVAIATPVQGDTTPANNVYIATDAVRASWDPNEKTVSKTNLPLNQLANELVYTVHFQNTGNDTAFNVLVRDDLSKKLDWGSFRMLGASHSFEYRMREKGLVEVTFANIGLPDSGKNYAASQGFFQYAIRPLTTLRKGDTIPNTASIYFDVNPAVVTNTTRTVITDAVTTAVNTATRTAVAEVYPNPAKDVLYIRLSEGSGRLVLSDISGRVFLSSIIGANAEIDLRNLPSGMLIGRIETSAGVKVFKVNKMD